MKHCAVIWIMMMAGLLVFPLQAGANPFSADSGRQREVESESSVFESFRRQGMRSWIRIVRIQKDLSNRISGFIRAIEAGEDNRGFWFAWGLAFLYGLLHAVGPGHGKILVSGFFLSQKARWWHPPLTGVKIAVLHVISALVVVTVTDSVTRQALNTPAGQLPAVRIISYGLISGIGLLMMLRVTPWMHRKHTGFLEKHETTGLAMAVGIVPCTGALLILFLALAHNIIITGIFLTLALAAGIAVTLTGVGLVCFFVRCGMFGRALQANPRWAKIGRGIQFAGGLLIFLCGLLLMGSAA